MRCEISLRFQDEGQDLFQVFRDALYCAALRVGARYVIKIAYVPTAALLYGCSVFPFHGTHGRAVSDFGTGRPETSQGLARGHAPPNHIMTRDFSRN